MFIYVHVHLLQDALSDLYFGLIVLSAVVVVRNVFANDALHGLVNASGKVGWLFTLVDSEFCSTSLKNHS